MIPIFIIGAPRSGTNILRDTITSNADYITWDCDEINYIWRYGHPFKKDDIFNISDLNNKNSKYIKNKFSEIVKLNYPRGNFLIEKTCANCLRVNFVNKLFPEGKFIYIKRDPYDCINSIKERWVGDTTRKYLFKKAKYVPKKELLYYVFRYFSQIIRKSLRKSNEMPTWGPRFKDIDIFRRNHSLIETCAKQWKECTHKAEKELKEVDNLNNKVTYITYEELIIDPQKTIKLIFKNLNIPINFKDFDIRKINQNSIGKGKNALTKYEKLLIDNLINE